MTQPETYQGMSPIVMAKLLTLVQVYDRKFSFEEVDVKAFLEVAVAYRWTAHEAEAAIKKWGATEAADGFMSPATLNTLIRHMRQDRLMRQPVATAFGPRVAEETVRQRVMAVWAQEQRLSKQRSRDRKALIAKHPDLVEKFNEIGFMGFERWNGWIAPATIPDASPGATGPTTDLGTGYKRNLSYVRAALVEIEAEAERREGS